MKPVDIIIILIIALIVGAASCYIYRVKKKGKGCIGCPDSASCHKYNESVHSCGGNCTCGGHGHTAEDEIIAQITRNVLAQLQQQK